MAVVSKLLKAQQINMTRFSQNNLCLAKMFRNFAMPKTPQPLARRVITGYQNNAKAPLQSGFIFSALLLLLGMKRSDQPETYTKPIQVTYYRGWEEEGIQSQNLDLQEILDAADETGLRVLDFSSLQLLQEDWQYLENWLTSRGILRIKTQQPIPEFIERILSASREQYTDRPTLSECALFCNLAYDAPDEIIDQLPSGWEIMKNSPNPGDYVFCNDPYGDGYYGVAFINHDKKQIVVGHRGTEFGLSSFTDIKEFIKDLKQDALSVFLNYQGPQENTADEFTTQVNKISQQMGYHLTCVGHSLGGWLAQTSAYSIQSRNPSQDVFAFALDTPGSRKMIEEHLKPRYGKNRAADLDNVDFVCFLSYPDLVNMANTHVGRIYQLYPDMSQYLSHPISSYLLAAHDRQEQAKVLYKLKSKDISLSEAFSEVSDWPSVNAHELTAGEYLEFFKHAKAKNLFKPSPDNPRQAFQLNHKAHYQTHIIDAYTLPLSGFSQKAQQFLTELSKRLEEEPDIIDKIASKHQIPRDQLAFLDNVTIKKIHLATQVSIQASEEQDWKTHNILTFRRQLALLLTMYDELPTFISYKEFQARLRDNQQWHGLLTSIDTAIRDQSIALTQLNQLSALAPMHRLYLFNKAGYDKIKAHEDIQKELEQKLKATAILQNDLKEPMRLASGKAKSQAERLMQTLNEHQNQLTVVDALNSAMLAYKNTDLQTALNKCQETLAILDQSQNLQINAKIIQARVCCLQAKIYRSLWSLEGTDDLEKSAECYLKALTLAQEEPVTFSNYGALLNDWGEYVCEGQARVDKHAQALNAHQTALDRAPRNTNIIRDHARARFHLAKAKWEQGQLKTTQYLNDLKDAATDLKETDPSRSNPTNSLFLAMVLEELAQHTADPIEKQQAIDDALECTKAGLRVRPKHSTLKARYAYAVYLNANDDKDQLMHAKNELEQALHWLEQAKPSQEMIRHKQRIAQWLEEMNKKL